MKYIYFGLFLVFTGIVSAQDYKYVTSYPEYAKNQLVHLFGNNVHLREKPSSDSKSLELMPIGSYLEILVDVEDMYNRGLTPIWLKVSHEGVIGYVRSDFLAQQIYMLNNHSLFVQMAEVDDQYFLSIRNATDNNTFKQYDYLINSTYVNLEITGNKGLSNLDNIILINYLAESCGENGGGKYIFINNGNWIEAFDYTQVVDGGVYYWDENLVFPNEHNKGDFMIYTSESMVAIYEDDQYEMPVSSDKHIKERILRWNGKNIYPKIDKTSINDEL